MLGAGALGAFRILHYSHNCEFKNTGLIQLYRYLQAILTGLLIVRMYTQLEPRQLEYYLFLARRYQIRMYLITSRIYTMKLPSLARVYLYCRFATW